THSLIARASPSTSLVEPADRSGRLFCKILRGEEFRARTQHTGRCFATEQFPQQRFRFIFLLLRHIGLIDRVDHFLQCLRTHLLLLRSARCGRRLLPLGNGGSPALIDRDRSEERRVGKEWRVWVWRTDWKEKQG